MNILIINYDYPPIGAGAAKASREIALGLKKRGHRISVLTMKQGSLSDFTISEGISIFRINVFRRYAERSNMIEMFLFVIFSILKLKNIIRQSQVEKIIVFYSLPLGPIALFAKKFFRIPYLVSLRGGDVPNHVKEMVVFHKILAPIRRAVLKNSIAVVANSPSFAELSKKTDPFDVKYIPNGVDFSKYTCKRKRKNSIFQLVYVGRLRFEKNIHGLLENIHEFVTRFPDDRFELHLIGDGDEREHLEEMVQSLGLEKFIFFEGWLSEEKLIEFLGKADCIVNPSFGEGMPNAVLEAMSVGLCVLASNVRGNDAVVRHGKTGFLYDLESKNEFCKFLHKLIGDQVQSEKFGIAAKTWVEKDFSWEKVSKMYENLLAN